MSRPEKLYRTLDSLEQEFLTVLKQEFEAIATGSSSWFLTRKTSWLFNSEYWRDAELARIEKLEKDIISLRRKLGEPLGASPVAFVDEFARRYKDLPDKYHGGEEHLAKEFLKKLGGDGTRTAHPASE